MKHIIIMLALIIAATLADMGPTALTLYIITGIYGALYYGINYKQEVKNTLKS